MITILSALVSLLSFHIRSRAALELELIALRHQVKPFPQYRSRRQSGLTLDTIFRSCAPRTAIFEAYIWVLWNLRGRPIKVVRIKFPARKRLTRVTTSRRWFDSGHQGPSELFMSATTSRTWPMSVNCGPPLMTRSQSRIRFFCQDGLPDP
jgi:hypothetical protein